MFGGVSILKDQNSFCCHWTSIKHKVADFFGQFFQLVLALLIIGKPFCSQLAESDQFVLGKNAAHLVKLLLGWLRPRVFIIAGVESAETALIFCQYAVTLSQGYL